MDRGVTRIFAVVACLTVAGCGSGSGPTPIADVPTPTPPRAAEWRQTATAQDRGRLRGWRSAWINALAQLPAGTAARAPVLFDPDRALADPVPPDGAYRCRTLKLGARTGTGPTYTPYGWFGCRVGHDEMGRQTFVKLTGSQRPAGRIYADTEGRAVFLGTMQLGDETRPIAYGRDAGRDMAGVIERIGPRHWRIVLPYPKFESILDVIELVPG